MSHVPVGTCNGFLGLRGLDSVRACVEENCQATHHSVLVVIMTYGLYKLGTVVQ